MFDPHLLRKAVPLTFLAFSACGVAPQSATPDAPTGGSAVARLADGGATSCPNGGNVLKYGIDKNGNGKLDDNEVLGTFDICNGTSGTLTKISNIAPGAQCSQGGVIVQTGPDTNNNGTLDDSEATSSTPICSVNGQITSVVGSIYIESDEDIARYASTETVSGYVSLGLTGINGTVTLPKLRAVGMDLDVYTNGGGYGFLNAEQPKAAQHARNAERKRALHVLNNIPTSTVTLSMPALQSVGGNLQVNNGVILSVPALNTVGNGIECNDPNATFPALVSLGEYDGCGDPNVIFAQLTFYGDNYPVAAPVFSNTKLTSVGVKAAYGNTDWTNGGLQFADPNFTSVSLPNLTQAGDLYLGGVYSSSATLNLPALATVGAVFLDAEQYAFDFLLTPPALTIYPFAATLPLLTVKGCAVEMTQTPNRGYASVVGQLQHVGGVFQTRYANGVTAVNANNLQTAGGISIFSNANVTTVAFPQLAALAPADPNYEVCDGDLSDGNLIECNTNDANGLVATASVVLQGNPNVTSINFGTVNSIPGGLYLQGNPNLASVSGLSHLTKLGYASSVNAANTSFVSSLLIDNTGLTDLSAFASITSAPGVTGITYNAHLADITALHLTGSSDTCPVIEQNPQLPYCQAVNFITAYNADCSVSGDAADLGLKDPCANVTCTGSTQCVPDCTPGSTTGYLCQ